MSAKSEKIKQYMERFGCECYKDERTGEVFRRTTIETKWDDGSVSYWFEKDDGSGQSFSQDEIDELTFLGTYGEYLQKFKDNLGTCGEYLRKFRAEKMKEQAITAQAEIPDVFNGQEDATQFAYWDGVIHAIKELYHE